MDIFANGRILISNQNMSIIKKQFFELLKAGLWGTKPDLSLFEGIIDWKELYKCARKQALLGVIFDGVQELPKELMPERPVYLQWCNAALQIEDNNRLLNRELKNVYDLAKENGITAVLFKGQGVAQNYRNPLHRNCGDIDLYIGEKDFEKMNSLLRREGTDVLEECYKHTNMLWHDITIENHRVLTELSAPLANRALQREINRWYSNNDLRKRTIGEAEVLLAPMAFDTAYVLVHAVQHFLNEGIGLRQICDWACMLTAQKKEAYKDETVALLKSFGMERAAKVLGALICEFMGGSRDILPIDYEKHDIDTAKWLLEDIWIGGNFGQYNVKSINSKKGYWKKKLFTFERAWKRCKELGQLAPEEAKWYPAILTVHSIQMQWKKIKKKMGLYSK